jgi:hypothetical protein
MKSKKWVFLLLLGILFIYGCQTGETTTSGLQGAYANCYGDDVQMISAEFDDYAPVNTEANPYQPGEEIDISVLLTSYFTEDIEAGNVKVRLTGDAASENVFTGAEMVMASTLYAIDTETCLEEDTEAEIGPLVYQPEITTKVSKEISGLYCYTQDVVVKAYLYYTEDEAEISTNLPSGSNPPSAIQVTSIEQNPVDVQRDLGTGDLRFKIYLQNVGAGTLVESLDDCFEYRESGYNEEFTLSVTGAYDDIDCPTEVSLSRDEKTDVISCKVSGIDITNLGSSPSEIEITLSGFAYEDEIPATTLWLEP